MVASASLTRRAVVSAAPAAALFPPSPVWSADPPLLQILPQVLPQIGLGTCCAGPSESLSQIAAGLDAGYRLLDTAAHYESESSVGAAVEDAVRRGTVRRDEITICTKLWMDDMGYDSALRAARRSLERLRSDRLDVFLVHFPGTIDAVQDPKRNRQLRAETWRALETLQRDGVAKRIGVSNWTRRHLKETLASCQIKPELLQIEFHPRLQQSALIADAADAGIKVMAACPLATGADALLADPMLARVATRYGRTPAQVALRWAVQRGVLPIPKATSAARLRENLGALEFSLDAEAMGAIDGLEADDRYSFDPRLIA